MIDTGGSNWVRVGAYLVVAALTLVALRRESDRAAEVDGVWPPFWPLTGGFLVVMAVGRAGGVGDLIAGLARNEVVSGGWYESRRPVQAAVVGAVGLAWLISVSVACWRTPERRRRYLPIGLAIVTLAAFAAIRLVSLHQVDTLLHRRHIGGVRVGTLTELGLVLLAGIMTFRIPTGRSSPTTSLVAPDGGVLES